MGGRDQTSNGGPSEQGSGRNVQYARNQLGLQRGWKDDLRERVDAIHDDSVAFARNEPAQCAATPKMRTLTLVH